jgi:hypothetical protein
MDNVQKHNINVLKCFAHSPLGMQTHLPINQRDYYFRS